MKKEWWKEAVVYQIYPKSFQDSDDDGIGDLRGIINRLPYLKKLGIDVIWLCPVYQSPMDDGGYDISDYYTVDSMFGSNEDLDELIKRAEQLEIKVLMDLVVNHTSDEHEWFQEALKNPHSKYRNYYVFREGVNGNPPNNWRSYFGSSAWEPVEGEENMYYLHAFTKKQPDLNWENTDVREDIYEMINYWLEKGLGGFRIDAILNIKKRLEMGVFESDGEDGLAFIGHWILNQPGIESWLNELNERTFKRYNSMTVAEADVPEERLAEYIGSDGYFSMVFDFSYTDIDVPETGEWFKQRDWTWEELKQNIYKSQLTTQEHGWGALYLENHDQPRSINKYLKKEDVNPYSIKMLGTLFMMLRGTPFIYQGQEIGMQNIDMENMSDFDDIASHDQYQRGILSGLSPEASFAAINLRSRDNSRTPMQWSDQKHAGFSNSKATWLKVNSNYPIINAEKQLIDKDSVYHYYQSLIHLRKKSPYKDVIVYGDIEPSYIDNKSVLAYKRILEKQELLVLINHTNEVQYLSIEENVTKLILSNYKKEKTILSNEITLEPFESLILGNF